MEVGRRSQHPLDLPSTSVRPADATSTSSSTLVNVDEGDSNRRSLLSDNNKAVLSSTERRQRARGSTSPFARSSALPKARRTREQRLSDAPSSALSTSSSTTTRRPQPFSSVSSSSRARQRGVVPVSASNLPLCPDDCRCSDQELERGVCRRALAEASSGGATTSSASASEVESSSERRLPRNKQGSVHLAWDPSERRRNRELAQQRSRESRSPSVSTVMATPSSIASSSRHNMVRVGGANGRDLQSDPVIVPRSRLVASSASNSSDEGDGNAYERAGRVQTTTTASSASRRPHRTPLRELASSPGLRGPQSRKTSAPLVSEQASTPAPVPASTSSHGSVARRSIADVFERLLQEEQRRRQEDKEKRQRQREKLQQERAKRESEHESDWDDATPQKSHQRRLQTSQTGEDTPRLSSTRRLQHDVDRLHRLSTQSPPSLSPSRDESPAAHKTATLAPSSAVTTPLASTSPSTKSAARDSSDTHEHLLSEQVSSPSQHFSSPTQAPLPPSKSHDVVESPNSRDPSVSIDSVSSFAFPDQSISRQAPIQVNHALVENPSPSPKRPSPLTPGLMGSGRFSPGDPSSPRRNSHRRSGDVDILSVSRRLPTTMATTTTPQTTPQATPSLPSVPSLLADKSPAPSYDSTPKPAKSALLQSPNTMATSSARKVRFSPQPDEVFQFSEHGHESDEMDIQETPRPSRLQGLAEVREGESDDSEDGERLRPKGKNDEVGKSEEERDEAKEDDEDERARNAEREEEEISEEEEDGREDDFDKSIAGVLEPKLDLDSISLPSALETSHEMDLRKPVSQVQSPYVPGAYSSPAVRAGMSPNKASPSYSRHVLRPRGSKVVEDTPKTSPDAIAKEEQNEEENEQAFWNKENNQVKEGIASPPRPFAWTSALSKKGSMVYSPPDRSTKWGLGNNRGDLSRSASLASITSMENLLEEEIEEEYGEADDDDDDEITQGSQYRGGAPRASTPPSMDRGLQSIPHSDSTLNGRQKMDEAKQSEQPEENLQQTSSMQVADAQNTTIRSKLERLRELLKERQQTETSSISPAPELPLIGSGASLSQQIPKTEEGNRSLQAAEKRKGERGRQEELVAALEHFRQSRLVEEREAEARQRELTALTASFRQQRLDAEEEDRTYRARADEMRSRLNSLLQNGTFRVSTPSPSRPNLLSSTLTLLLHLLILFLFLRLASLRASFLYHHPYSLVADPFGVDSDHRGVAAASTFSILPRRLPLWNLGREMTERDGLLSRLDIFPPGFFVDTAEGLGLVGDLPLWEHALLLSTDGGVNTASSTSRLLVKVILDVVWRHIRAGRANVAWRIFLWNLARSVGWDGLDEIGTTGGGGGSGLLVPT